MKITRFVLFILHCSWLVALTACSSASSEARPPEIHYGEDVCDACGMLISDAKFAAAAVEEDGTARKFDDIGDLVSYYADHTGSNVNAYFVHDYPSEQWLRAETALFVVSPQIQTPMAHGIAAYADRAAAESAAQKHDVKVMTFDALRQTPLSSMSHAHRP